MIAVSLLGHVSVSVDGAPISGEAAQRRRVALLALLCTPPAKPFSRDRLMLYLWPESDVESARHLLSVAVHVLRKSVGHDVLVTTADEVSVTPGSVQVDVAAFEDAVTHGDHETAVALYGGPFMDGFHAGAGVELDQWIDEERTQLQRAFAQSLEGLAEKKRAAGDAAGAVDAWRRLAALDPYASHGALGLMRALAEAGNRAGAIRHAAVHRQLLEGELGAGPDPDVEALAEALRTEPDVVAPPVSAPPARPSAGRAAGATPATAPGDVAGAATPALPTATGVAASPGSLPAGLSSTTLGVLAPDGPHGVPRPGQPLPRRWRRARWGVVVLVLVAVALVGYFARRSGAAKEEPAVPRVAVLPFASLGPDSGQVYLGDGIAEQILNALGRVRGLEVVARTSSFRFRGGRLDARAIGDSLDAQYVLEGSLQRSSGMLRVTVGLADARTGKRVWGDDYDKPDGDILAIEDEITREVVRKVNRQLLGELAAAGEASTADARAHDLFLQALSAWYQRTPTSLMQAADSFEKATLRDTAYAEAFAGLAQTMIVAGSYDYGLLAPDSAYPLAERAARRAARLRPGLAEAHAALGAVYQNYYWASAAAEREFVRAVEREPHYSPARQWYGLLLASQRRNKEALAQLDAAAETDPRSPVLFATRAQYYYYGGDYEASIKEGNRALELDSAFAPAHLIMALAQIQAGHAANAAQRVQQVAAQAEVPVVMAVLGYAQGRARDRTGALASRNWLTQAAARGKYVPAELFALVEVGLGNPDSAIIWLEKAKDRHSNGMAYLGVEPALDPLRSNPRFVALEKAVAATGRANDAGLR